MSTVTRGRARLGQAIDKAATAAMKGHEHDKVNTMDGKVAGRIVSQRVCQRGGRQAAERARSSHDASAPTQPQAVARCPATGSQRHGMKGQPTKVKPPQMTVRVIEAGRSYTITRTRDGADRPDVTPPVEPGILRIDAEAANRDGQPAEPGGDAARPRRGQVFDYPPMCLSLLGIDVHIASFASISMGWSFAGQTGGRAAAGTSTRFQG